MMCFNAVYKTPTEKGQRTIIDVPFNVWDEFNLRGPVPVNVRINNFSFESKLSPKGKGFYALFFTKDMCKTIMPNDGDTLHIEIEPRIIEAPPPIDLKDARKIDNIVLVKEPVSTACGQSCIAMLAGVDISDVFKTMKTKGPTSSKMLIDAMYHYKICHGERFLHFSKEQLVLPETCLLQVKMPNYGHWVVYHKGVFYDPEFGELSACHENGKISSFLEIYTS